MSMFYSQGGYAGNAAGMKISSLNKLSDIRSNRPGLTLLHYVAGQAEETNADLLTLPEDFALLEEASKTPIDILQVEINKLETQIKKIQNQMKAPNVSSEVKERMGDFLPVSFITSGQGFFRLLPKNVETGLFVGQLNRGFAMTSFYLNLLIIQSKHMKNK